tara:strand:+ start:277 stop:498 length:222 start_codon:yes stop_codon:yes gene_type:complete
MTKALKAHLKWLHQHEIDLKRDLKQRLAMRKKTRDWELLQMDKKAITRLRSNIELYQKEIKHIKRMIKGVYKK